MNLLRRTWHRVLKWWPLVWKARLATARNQSLFYEQLCGSRLVRIVELSKELVAAEAELSKWRLNGKAEAIKLSEARILEFQKNLESFVEKCGRQGFRILPPEYSDRPGYEVVMTDPTIDYLYQDKAIADRDSFGKVIFIKLEILNFRVSLGLPPDVAPELVAGEIASGFAAKIKAEILRKWQHQSLLSKPPFGRT